MYFEKKKLFKGNIYKNNNFLPEVGTTGFNGIDY